MADLAGIPLRERKHAQTKLALLNAAVQQLEHKGWDEISVKELCEAALVSEATFFNYFPRKSDVLAYYVQLWSLEVAWYAQQRREKAPDGLGIINEVFQRASQRIQERPLVMGEVIAQQARLREKPRSQDISRAERLLAYPELEGIEAVSATGLDSILMPALQRAIEREELPGNTPLHTVMVALISIFYGVPLALRMNNPQGIGSMYQHQLNVLWAGLHAVSQRPE